MWKRLETIFRPESKYRAFFLSVITVGLSYGLYKGVIDNYLAEIVGMSGFDKGVSEFFRELPGLLLVFILAALYMYSAERIYKIGAVFMLAGLASQAVVPPSRVLVILCIFIYSLGEHMQLGMRNTITLEYASRSSIQGKAAQAKRWACRTRPSRSAPSRATCSSSSHFSSSETAHGFIGPSLC